MTLYFNNAVNSAWDTLGNWWQNVEFTTPASSLPTTNDTVYLYGAVGTPPATPVTLAHVYVSPMVLGWQDEGNYSFVADLTGVTAPKTVNDNTKLAGTCAGNVTMNDFTRINPAAVITGDCVFNRQSFIDANGRVNGNCIFNDDSGAAISSRIFGNATFNDNSYGSGLLNGEIKTPWVREGADLVSDKVDGLKVRFLDVPEGGGGGDILGAGLL